MTNRTVFLCTTGMFLFGIMLLFWGAIELTAATEPIDIPRPAAQNDDDLPAPLSGIVQIAAGRSHTCALTNGGSVKCWGNNFSGQLGDSTEISSHSPVAVIGLNSSITAITTGASHTCALTNGGGVKCWGSNFSSQLGDGTETSTSIPVDVVELGSSITTITAGESHTCALTNGGGVKCWGDNSFGQLGDGTTTDSSTPVDVAELSDIIDIALDGNHTCALANDGGVKCWGNNRWGALGDGTLTSSSTPVDVRELSSGVTAIVARAGRMCALTNSNKIKCWGYQYAGSNDQPQPYYSNTPTDIMEFDSGVTAIAIGWSHNCALTDDGGVKCWGLNKLGQLGSGTWAVNWTPGNVAELNNDVTAIAAGNNHTCALTGSGVVKCWGSNSHGQLGDGITTDNRRAVDGLGNGVTAITAGAAHSCALVNGEVKCWGLNENGQLGNGTLTARDTPVDVSGLGSDNIAIAAGDNHTCAVANDSGVKCWGWNGFGQLGDGTDVLTRTTPVAVIGVDDTLTSITAGRDHTCVLTNDGGVKCWGLNGAGQLGDNSISTRRSLPVDVVGLNSGIIAIVAGGGHTCALTNGGSVKCWGDNSFGQLGDGTEKTISRIPVDVVGLDDNIIAIAVGWSHTCALSNSADVKCWGSNEYGQLGDNTQTNNSKPVDVKGLGGDVTAITAGGWYAYNSHTCALTDGQVKCWGNNEHGQLGDDTTTNHPIPVDVVGLNGYITVIESGRLHACALSDSGQVRCWGSNKNGQLGINPGWRPIDVVNGDSITPPVLDKTLFLPVIQAGNHIDNEDDDLELFYYSKRNGVNNIYKSDLQGNETPIIIDNDHHDWWVRVSPDRETILWYKSPLDVPANDEFNNYDEAELWMANYDGSSPHKVIDLVDYSWSAQGVADWSPDCKELVMAVTDLSGLWHIYITDADGTNPRKISQRESLYADPSWSPDGQRIVYSAFPEGYVGINTFKLEIHIMDRDGSNEIRLTHDEFQDHDPYWSPDGKEIAFETLWGLSNCSVIGKWAVRKYNFDSRQTTFIIQDENATGIPRWTRDSKTIYLGRTVCGELTKAVRTDREGSNLQTMLSSSDFPIYDADIVESAD